MEKRKTKAANPDRKARVRCADCRHARPKSDMCVHCDILNVGRVKNSFRTCENYVERR